MRQTRFFAQGSQTRTFVYDSLKRLTSATNPESGTVSYQYDNNGNLTQKTDARSVISTYTYDALNRNVTVDYSNTTANPDIARYYDNPINYGKGRYWYDYYYQDDGTINHQAVDGYDALGRVWVRRQVFYSGGQWYHYETRNTYDLAGHVLSQQYPSAHVVNYQYDSAGRTPNFSGNLGDGVTRTYSSNVTYNARSQMQVERLGTNANLYHKLHYNSRGQVYDIRLSTVPWATDPLNWNRGCLLLYYDSGYHWGGLGGQDSGPDNNGNVLRMTYYRPGDDQISTFSANEETFTYDSLNRVTLGTDWYQTGQGYTQQFAQAYSYDRYGNRTINTAQTWGTGINNQQFSVDPSTNRLGVPTGYRGVMTYDNAGNLIFDSYSGEGTRTFDAENRMTTAWANSQWQSYSYDADGHRARRTVNGTQTWQVYGPNGELLAEYAANAAASSPQKEYGYRSGELLVTAESSANIHYLVTDQLGTPRMIVDQSGSLSGVSRHDYLPFGEELFAGTGGRTTAQGYSASDGLRNHFTGKERDNETGLDYFLARYYSSTQGRFTSPDEFTGGPEELFEDVDPHDPLFYADITEPQSLNKYHYALNNPLRYIDPDGHQTTTSDRLRQAAATAADFGGGAVRGVVSSFTFGLVGGPDARDSRANRAGQVVGTVVEGVAGLVVAGPGSGAITLGSDGVAAVTGVSEATVVAGVTMTAGSVVNLARIATTPMQRNSTSNARQDSNQTSSGAKSASEYDKHAQGVQKAKQEAGQLREQLSNTRGPKRQAPY